jgi:hypothetical protein
LTSQLFFNSVRESQLYSILEAKHEQVIAKPGRLVTNEIECNPPTNRMEVRMNKKTEKSEDLLVKNSFRKIVYITLIAATLIVNLDYIQPRDSSKADFLIDKHSIIMLQHNAQLTRGAS